LFFYILRQRFSLKRGFLSLREMQIVNTDYPLLEFGQRHFSRKKYNVLSLEGIYTFKVPPPEKSGTGREFSPAASEFTYSINALGPCVRLAGCAEECY
jgi:hypothetical protein